MVVISAIFWDLGLFLDFGHDFLLYRASYRTKISLQVIEEFSISTNPRVCGNLTVQLKQKRSS